MLETQSKLHLSSTTAHSPPPFKITVILLLYILFQHKRTTVSIGYYFSIYIRNCMKQGVGWGRRRISAIVGVMKFTLIYINSIKHVDCNLRDLRTRWKIDRLLKIPKIFNLFLEKVYCIFCVSACCIGYQTIWLIDKIQQNVKENISNEWMNT